MSETIKRNLEQGGQIYLNRFMTGQVTNRSPIFTPLSAMGLEIRSGHSEPTTVEVVEGSKTST